MPAAANDGSAGQDDRTSGGTSDGVPRVSPRELVALVRRHLAAFVVVLVLAAGLGYHLKHAEAPYADFGTVAYIAPGTGVNIFNSGPSLLVVNQTMTTYLMSPQGQQQVSSHGGEAPYRVAMVNLNNEDFPSYSVPYSTVSALSPDPAQAERTFAVVLQVLRDNLAARQKADGTNPREWVRVKTIAASAGPVQQTGSSKRALAGFATLAIIAVFMVLMFFDKHPVRLRTILRGRRRHG